MSSLVDMVNNSLDIVGESPITALDDGTTKSDICNRQATSVLRTMLYGAQWNFAYTRVSLAADVAAPVSGFALQYTLPPDCLRVWGIGDDPRLNGAPSGDLDWKVEQGKLLTNAQSPLTVHYGAYVTDPNKWGGGFENAFIKFLASRLTGAIVHDYGKMAELMKEYYSVDLPDALAADSQEQSIDVFYVPDLLEVRTN